MLRYTFTLILFIALFLSGCTEEEGDRGKVKFYLNSSDDQLLYIDGVRIGHFGKNRKIVRRFDPSDEEHVAEIRDIGVWVSGANGWNGSQTFRVEIGSDRVQQLYFTK